jgi:hypothetical protein
MAKVREDCFESGKSLLERLGIEVASDASCHWAQEGAGERYGGVEDYDPVLRSHCRLDEPGG